MNKAKAVSALELYVEDLRGNSRPQEGAIGVGRQSAINDLVDTAKLLKSLEVDDDIWKRFYDLAHALDDLKHENRVSGSESSGRTQPGIGQFRGMGCKSKGGCRTRVPLARRYVA